MREFRCGGVLIYFSNNDLSCNLLLFCLIIPVWRLLVILCYRLTLQIWSTYKTKTVISEREHIPSVMYMLHGRNYFHTFSALILFLIIDLNGFLLKDDLLVVMSHICHSFLSHNCFLLIFQIYLGLKYLQPCTGHNVSAFTVAFIIWNIFPWGELQS